MTGENFALNREKIMSILNKTSIVYSVVVLIYQLAYTIVPVRQFLNYTGLTVISSLMAVGGVAIAVLNTMFNRKIFISKLVWLLITILGIMGVSTLLNFEYGFTQNIKTIIWQVALLLVIFTSSFSNESNYLITCFKWTYWILNVFYLPALIISLYQYYNNIHYIANVEMGTVRQGFVEGRLFGIFSSPHFAAISTVVLLLASLYYLFLTNNRALKSALVVIAVLNFLYTVLSGSRSASLATCATVLIIAIVVFYKKAFLNFKFGKIIRLFIAVVLSFTVTAGTYALFDVTARANVFILKQINQDIGQDIPEDEMPEDEPIYEREDIEMGNVSNNRFTIWREYIEVALGNVKTALFGASPGSYMIYTAENYPDKYIVSHIKEIAPNMYEHGIIYDTHNAYIGAFVSTGIIGFILLLAFLVICAIKVLKRIFSKKDVSLELILAIAFVVFTLAVSFFDSDLFYKCTGTSVIFWLFCGILVKNTINFKNEDKQTEDK